MTHTESQMKAITATDPLVTVAAGPGSGKTSTLVGRAVHLMSTGVRSEEIVLFTYTVQAAGEIQRRLAETCGRDDLRLGYVGTLHGFCLRLLRAAGKGGTVLSEAEEARLLAEHVAFSGYRGTASELEGALGQAINSRPPIPPTKAYAVAAGFVARLDDSGLITFDLILARTLQHLRAGSVTFPYAHLLVDEAQDLADVDAQIVEALPIPNKFLVGDPDQAIYGFRSGNVRNLLRFMERSRPVLLEENHRSGAAVCYHAQALIEHNKGRWKKHTRCTTNEKGSVLCVRHPDPQREIDFIAQQVKLMDSREIARNERKTKAVLARTNFLVDRIVRGLRASGVEVATRKQVELPKDWETILQLVALAQDRSNDYVATRLLARAIGDDAARRRALEAQAAGEVMADVIGFHDVGLAEIVQAATLLRVTDDSVRLLAAEVAKLPDGASIDDLAVALHEKAHDTREEPGAVVVSTIHAAKGREWDVVFLPCWEDGILPSGSDDGIEEERRLAYVGLTRARRVAVISYAEQRSGAWEIGPSATMPSRFIQDAVVFVTQPCVAHEFLAGLVTIPVHWEEATVSYEIELKRKKQEIVRESTKRWRENIKRGIVRTKRGHSPPPDPVSATA